jgi:hypothetical protein
MRQEREARPRATPTARQYCCCRSGALGCCVASARYFSADHQRTLSAADRQSRSVPRRAVRRAHVRTQRCPSLKRRARRLSVAEVSRRMLQLVLASGRRDQLVSHLTH